MATRSLHTLTLLALAAACAVGGSLAAQTPASSSDVLGAFLVEVSALRTAMERMASAGPRVELALGSLHLQEQRVNNLLRQHTEVRERVASLERDVAIIGRDLERVQDLSQSASNEGHRRDIERELPVLKERHAQMSSDLQRLRAEEAGLAQMLHLEQSRWTEINQRLEELERALAR